MRDSSSKRSSSSIVSIIRYIEANYGYEQERDLVIQGCAMREQLQGAGGVQSELVFSKRSLMSDFSPIGRCDVVKVQAGQHLHAARLCLHHLRDRLRNWGTSRVWPLGRDIDGAVARVSASRWRGA